jgi:hypothetical protein
LVSSVFYKEKCNKTSLENRTFSNCVFVALIIKTIEFSVDNHIGDDMKDDDWKHTQRKKNITFFSVLAAYIIFGFVIFGHFSKMEYISQGCPAEPGIERGLCFQSNAYYAALIGIAWPVYAPAKFLIYVGRNI